MDDILVDIHTHHPRAGVLSPTMAGIHPWDAELGLPLPDFSTVEVIGEIGLDYACKVDREAQARLFCDQLKIAEKLRKPVVLHTVKSFEQVMNILTKYVLESVVFHGFIGSKEQAKRATDKGYYLSFGYRSLCSPRTRHAIAATPLDRLFVESDDDPNTDLKRLSLEIAEIKSVSERELRVQINENYKKLFKLQ